MRTSISVPQLTKVYELLDHYGIGIERMQKILESGLLSDIGQASELNLLEKTERDVLRGAMGLLPKSLEVNVDYSIGIPDALRLANLKTYEPPRYFERRAASLDKDRRYLKRRIILDCDRFPYYQYKMHIDHDSPLLGESRENRHATVRELIALAGQIEVPSFYNAGRPFVLYALGTPISEEGTPSHCVAVPCVFLGKKTRVFTTRINVSRYYVEELRRDSCCGSWVMMVPKD